MNEYTVKVETNKKIIQRTENAFMRPNGGSFIATMTIRAETRKEAVKNALLWFWYHYRGELGPAKNTLTVSDPRHEVSYSNTFSCYSKENRYLEDETIERLIRESCGELERDNRLGQKNHRPGCLKRIKRRRKYWKCIAPTIYQSESGVLYYRFISQAQISKSGNILQKRRCKIIRLWSKTVPHALHEIRMRELRTEHKTRKWVKARSLKWIAFRAGLAPLSDEDRKYFATIMPKGLENKV